MSKVSSQKGYCGEKICRDYLINKGYNILRSNYHSRYGEIDIIACNDIYLIFVEVKTRVKNAIIKGYEAVNRAKMVKIIKTAYQFLSENSFKLQPRFDVCEIYFVKYKSNNEMIVSDFNYIKNAFDIDNTNLDIKM